MPIERGTKGKIYGIENVGMEKIVAFKVKDRIFRATVDSKHDFNIDSEIGFEFAGERLHFFDKHSGENLLD